MNRYRLARLADIDLDEIWLYIAKDNPSAADRQIAKFVEVFEMLATHPAVGEGRPEFRGGEFRSFSVGNYVVYFRSFDDIVEIARVVHGSRDVTALL